MNIKFLKIIGIGFILSVSTLANATLIDNGDYTTDTESGLDWLDWTLTLDKHTTFGGAGWRMATSSEAVALMLNNYKGEDRFDHSDIEYKGAAICSRHPCTGPTKNRFIELFGATVSDTITYAALSYVDEEPGAVYMMGFTEDYALANYYWECDGPCSLMLPNRGVPWVRAAAVPEPAIIALVALGLVGIGFARRRQS
jgi:hypothetical protein